MLTVSTSCLVNKDVQNNMADSEGTTWHVYMAQCRNSSSDLTSSVGRISKWEGLRSRRRGSGVWGEGVPLPTGEESGKGTVPPPQKNFAFFASKSHICDALWHPFEVILLLVENEQQCTKWFILQCYNQILLTDPGQDAFYCYEQMTLNLSLG